MIWSTSAVLLIFSNVMFGMSFVDSAPKTLINGDVELDSTLDTTNMLKPTTKNITIVKLEEIQLGKHKLEELFEPKESSGVSKRMANSEYDDIINHYFVFGPAVIVISIMVMGCMVMASRRQTRSMVIYKRAQTEEYNRRRRIPPLDESFEDDSDEDELFNVNDYKSVPKTGFVY
jgi:hypothetical protein